MPNNFNSLLVSNTNGWHDGDDVITYSFLGTEMPGYYRSVDTNGDGETDSWRAGSGDVPFDNDFSMDVDQRAMASLAVSAWNEVANVNLQPGTIERGGDDNDHGAAITGNGVLETVGGTALSTNDDGSSPVDISAVFEDGLNFFGTQYDSSQVFVNTNGNITFSNGLSTFTPSGISAGSTPMIAPFWADVDTRAGSPILVDVDAIRDVVTFTWDDVAFYSNNDNALNSFQLQLFDRGGGDFDIVFRYEDINWSAGEASGGDENGLGGVPARAGFSAGNSADFFELPQSGRQAEILNLENITGNTGVAGMWVFEVRDGALVGDIAFGSAEFNDSLYGFVSNFPNENHLGDRPSRAGDMWINNGNEDQYVPGTGPIYGHTSWNTYLHEMGHALGLRHPNERPNAAATNSQFTVMSYVPHPEEAEEDLVNQAFSLTPMVWDIQALQELYGANTETRSGDNVYFGDGNLSTSTGLAYQYATNPDNDLGMQVQGEDGHYRDVILTIWDAGGDDLIDASDMNSNSHIDLRPGRYSSIGEIDDNIAVAAAVRDEGTVINLIENAWGGGGNDRLIGNGTGNLLRGLSGRDTLSGGNGRDQLIGGNGNDTLSGGTGNDTLSGGNGRDRLNGNNGLDDIFGGRGNDRLYGHSGSDQLEGGAGADQIWGGRGHDVINGGAGNDQMRGNAGNDIFIFSTGNDVIHDFSATNGNEEVDLSHINTISGFNDLMNNHTSSTANGVLIEDQNGNTLLLSGVSMGDLDASDFIF